MTDAELDRLANSLNQVFIISLVIIVVFVLVCLLVKRIRENKHNNEKTVSSIPKIVFPPGYIAPEKPCLSDVDQYMKRVDEIFGKIGRGRENYVGFFNVKHDSAYMHALLKMPINGFDMWFIFYPNPDYNIFVMIFDMRISRKIIDPIKTMIDEFYGKDGEACDTTDGHPDFVWDEKGNYDIDITRNDLARATVMDPGFSGLWEQFL